MKLSIFVVLTFLQIGLSNSKVIILNKQCSAMFPCPLRHTSCPSVTKFLGELKWFWSKHTFNWKHRGIWKKHMKGFPDFLTWVKVMSPLLFLTTLNTHITLQFRNQSLFCHCKVRTKWNFKRSIQIFQIKFCFLSQAFTNV